MNYTPDYQIKTDGGDIPLLFNSWTFRKYTGLKGIEFEDLLDSVREGKAFRSSDLPELFLTAAESYCKFNKKDFSYTDLDAYEWIDQMGGFNSGQLMDVYKAFVSKLLNMSPEQFNVLWNKALEDATSPKEDNKKKLKKVG